MKPSVERDPHPLASGWGEDLHRRGFYLSPMTEADLDQVHAVEVQAHFHPWSRQNLADALTAGDRAWVCRDDTQHIVGYWLLRQVLDEAELLDITVAPSRQGQGLGRALLGHMLELAVQAGAKTVFLEVRHSNDPARRLYAAHGFRQTGLRKAYYVGPHGREDALLMAWQA